MLQNHSLALLKLGSSIGMGMAPEASKGQNLDTQMAKGIWRLKSLNTLFDATTPVVQEWTGMCKALVKTHHPKEPKANL